MQQIDMSAPLKSFSALYTLIARPLYQKLSLFPTLVCGTGHCAEMSVLNVFERPGKLVPGRTAATAELCFSLETAGDRLSLSAAATENCARVFTVCRHQRNRGRRSTQPCGRVEIPSVPYHGWKCGIEWIAQGMPELCGVRTSTGRERPGPPHGLNL